MKCVEELNKIDNFKDFVYYMQSSYKFFDNDDDGFNMILRIMK